MKNFLLFLLLSVLIISGCTTDKLPENELEGAKPPEVKLEIDHKIYVTILGTYCWSSKNKSECVDTGGPIELLEGKTPIKVKPGEEIKFVMDYEPKPNKFHVEQMIEQGGTEEVEVENDIFLAPDTKGVYYYSYGVWWMDERKENVANGSAFYAFVLEVAEDGN